MVHGTLETSLPYPRKLGSIIALVALNKLAPCLFLRTAPQLSLGEPRPRGTGLS